MVALWLFNREKFIKEFVDKNPIVRYARAKSPWMFLFGLACCFIETAIAMTPRFDGMERFGMLPRATPRQADVMVVAGWVTKKMAPRIKRLYEQMPEPKYVIAMGECAICGGPWYDSYNVVDGVDKIIPVDVYIPGCPPRPEALIDGVVKLRKKIRAGDTNYDRGIRSVGCPWFLEKSLVQEPKEGRMLINIGPQHPSTHGVLRLQVELDGERIVNITPVIGYLHRGFEKIVENRNYIQSIPLTDRLDYLSSMANNMVYVRAVEELMGIQIPERAEYIRVIVLELQRLASHLMSIAAYGNDLGFAATPAMYAVRDRERVIDLFESICGARVTYNYLRFGGVREDLPSGFKEKAKEVLAYLKPKIDEYERFLSEDEIFLMRTKGIGVLKPEDAINLGATGPVLRGSGVKTDTRITDSYTIYDKFEWEVVTGKDGDCFSRYTVWINEMRQSIRIVEQALDALPEGPYLAKVPKMLKPPAGEVYSRTESPRGELCMHLISDGTTTNPYRLKIRSPAFCNLSLLPHLARGVLIADMIAILGSLDPVFGEVDR